MKNKFQLLKEWKNVLKKSGKKYSEKAFIWVNSPFFPCFFFFFFKSNMNRSKRQKKKVILRNILSGNLTINLLINFAFFVLSKGVSIKVEVASRFE